jgi:protein-tyrosine phosphatase
MMRFEDTIMHQTNPYPLWVGHAGDGGAFRQILDRSIRAIVQLASEEAPLRPPRELIYVRFPLLDGTGNDHNLLSLAINAVAILLKKGVPTLVCCGGGMSRSPAIAAAGLAVMGHAPLAECLRLVAAVHPTDMSPGLLSDIASALDGGK